MTVTRAAPSFADLSAHCAGPGELVTLPRPVAGCLGLHGPQPRAAHLRAAAAWLERRPARSLRTDGSEEVVYQAFLGPFLGFDGERGTLCSLACHLPFLLERLAATTILLLPILERGRSRRKGRSGSPFAVADHRALDPAARGFGPHVPVDDVWAALVATCRRVGVRLGMIVPLATVSIDSPLIAETPALVHWWVADPAELLTGERADGEASPPAAEEWQVEAVPAPDALCRFTAPPPPHAVRTVVRGDDRLFAAADARGRGLSAANAYPDPIASDAATYSWQDVAAVRFGKAVAPVTYRGANGQQAGDINPAAASFVRNVLGSRLAHDGDVLLADVSSAVPTPLLMECVPPYPETMLVAEQLWDFRERDPFAFVTGPLIPCVAAHTRAPAVLARSLAYHLELLARTAQARWFFAGIANHDSLPCPERWARALLTLFCLLPRSVPFLYSGTESGCRAATNVEFGELGGRARPGEDELLLFNQVPVPPVESELERFTAFWRDLLALRDALGSARGEPSAIAAVTQDELVVTARVGTLAVATNCDPQRSRRVALDLVGRDVIGTEPFRRERGALILAPCSTLVIAPRRRLEGAGPSFVKSAA